MDLHATRERIAGNATSSQAEMERALAIAASPACAHAFVRLDDEGARAAARDPLNGTRPLAGLAVSIKDLFDITGQTTKAGSVALEQATAAAGDCPAVARLKAAGAAIVGRTNMSEFAFSGVGVNPHYGTPANPADTATPRIPGGSSSGAAVSVATGAAFVGLGSDTGGSIRIPAALTGIVGFKNTARLTPAEGAVPLSTTLDTVCAMTRSVRDAVAVHEILAQQRVRVGDAPLSSYRLAVARTEMLDALDPTVARAFERSLRTLRDGGARIEEIVLPPLAELAALSANGSFAAAESYAWHRQLLAQRGPDYDPRVRVRIERGATMLAHHYIDLIHARAQWIARMQEQLRNFDAVLSPTVPMVAPPIAQVAPGSERDQEFHRVNALLLRNTSVVNMLDGCALSIPCHAPDELPVGLMLWHGALHDDAILSLGLLVEATLRSA